MDSWVSRIATVWQSGLASVLECGRLLAAAKAELEHGQFEEMIKLKLPFKPSTAQRLMAVAADERISNPAHAQLLPSSWYTLYELSKLDDKTFSGAIADGKIRSDMQRSEVAEIIDAAKRAATRTKDDDQEGCKVDDLYKLISAGRKYGTIYGDPPWLYDNQATRAATVGKRVDGKAKHYEGMTVEEICALPIAELAAENCHLHLWTTNAFLFRCPEIFAAWGFEFRSTFAWVKPQIGIGNYWRNSHEILLTAIRGPDSKHFNDSSLRSWLEADRTRHSAKPPIIREFLKRASAGPRLELFGREAVHGWDVWGNEVSSDLLTSGIEEFVA
jgi:N6-adenosine-specific RNA methylase IME4